MDSQNVFCPNLNCPARGQIGQGNIGVFSLKERRYICHQCHKTFAASKGTVFYRLHSDPAVVTLVVTLLAHGCLPQAIVAAFALDERSVANWHPSTALRIVRVSTAHKCMITWSSRLAT